MIGQIKIKEKFHFFKLEDFILKVQINEPFNHHDFETQEVWGWDFENNKTVLFNLYSLIRVTNKSSYEFEVHSYVCFLYNNHTLEYDSITIEAEELNYFYKVSNAYTFDGSIGEKLNLSTIPFHKLGKHFTFKLMDKCIKGEFNFARTHKPDDVAPLRLNTNLIFKFNKTEKNLSIAHDLYYSTYNLLQFLTYRKNISFNRIRLYKKKIKNEFENITIPVGELYINSKINTVSESKYILKNRVINISQIEDSLNNLMQKIASGSLFLEHVPLYSKDRFTFTSARFILIASGFEWQFNSMFKDNKELINNKEYKQEIISFLEERVANTSGKAKKFFKAEKRKYEKDSLPALSKRVRFALNEFIDVLEVFIKKLYSVNSLNQLNFEDISKRIERQRNKVAHGNISMERDDEVVRDFILLEWIYYSMVLKQIGVDTLNIKRAINDLFNQRVYISDKRIKKDTTIIKEKWISRSKRKGRSGIRKTRTQRIL